MPRRSTPARAAAALALAATFASAAPALAADAPVPTELAAGALPVPADFNGDGRTDKSTFRYSTGQWFTAGQATVAFGAPGDVPAPAQWDADAATDRAVFRPTSGRWYVEGQPGSVAYGTAGDLPVPEDYSGDGLADLAVFRPSNGRWYVNGGPTTAFGTRGDVPVPGQWDDDPAADLAVFRPASSTWYVQGKAAVRFGAPGDVPVPGQWDGDPFTDIAVYRPSSGRWYVDGVASPVAYGNPTDVPAPGQYDADGPQDVGLFRPSNRSWYALAEPAQGAVAVGSAVDQPLGLPTAVYWSIPFASRTKWAGTVAVTEAGGRLLAVNPDTGATTTISDNAMSKAAGGKELFEQLESVAQEPSGNYIVIARTGTFAPDPNPTPSRVIRVDAATGRQSLVVADPRFRFNMTSVVVTPDGTIYVGEEDSATPGPDGSVIWRVDPVSGAVTVATDNDTWFGELGHTIQCPIDLEPSEDGNLFVMACESGTREAPDEPSDYEGAIVRSRLSDGRPSYLTTNYLSKKAGGAVLFQEPRGFALVPYGDFYVIDDPVFNNPSNYDSSDVRVIRMERATGRQALVSTNAKSVGAGGGQLFDGSEYGIDRLPDGTLVVVSAHRVVRVNPSSGAQKLVASDLEAGKGIVRSR